MWWGYAITNTCLMTRPYKEKIVVAKADKKFHTLVEKSIIDVATNAWFKRSYIALQMVITFCDMSMTPLWLCLRTQL